MAREYREGLVKGVPLLISRASGIILNPHFWIAVTMFAIGIVFHYPQQILAIDSYSLFSFLGLTRHAMERILFLLPITYVGFIFGLRWGLISLAVALAIMLPRLILISQWQQDAVFETIAVILIGGLVNLWFEVYKGERERRRQALLSLEAAQRELQSHIQVIENNARRLATLNEFSSIVSASLELQDVLNATIDNVVEVMDAEVALVFLLDEEAQELTLEACQGVSEEFAVGLRGLNVGEGLNGRVAQTGELLLVADASHDPRFTPEAAKREGIQAGLVVPLKAKGKVVGTLAVAAPPSRQFVLDDVRLLSHIANHVAIAVENARLYQKQRIMVERIARDAETEKQMREELRFYFQQVTRAQEEERRRIARELHDDTAQELVALSRGLDTFISSVDRLSSQDATRLEEVREQVKRILAGVRRFSQDLRPSVLDDLGLLPALEWLTSELGQHFGIAIDMNVVGLVRRFSLETELILFRIAQEALRNVGKHSGASRAWVTLEFDSDKTVLTVKDNGKGFELPEKIGDLAVVGKLGLAGMKERAQLIRGKLSLQSEMGKGTTITVVVPTSQV